MEFEKVTKEHILEAIKDFEEQGIPFVNQSEANLVEVFIESIIG